MSGIVTIVKLLWVQMYLAKVYVNFRLQLYVLQNNSFMLGTIVEMYEDHSIVLQMHLKPIWSMSQFKSLFVLQREYQQILPKSLF